jgi:multidrug efflux pump subunit AcrB
MEYTTVCLWIMNKSNLFKRFAYSIIVGSLGSLLLVVFFTTLMSYGTIEKLLPWVIGFNAALTGYNLINRTNNRLKYERICAVGSGILMVIITVMLINIIFFNLMGFCPIYFNELIFLITIGAVLSGLGAILANNFIKLKGGK